MKVICINQFNNINIINVNIDSHLINNLTPITLLKPYLIFYKNQVISSNPLFLLNYSHPLDYLFFTNTVIKNKNAFSYPKYSDIIMVKQNNYSTTLEDCTQDDILFMTKHIMYFNNRYGIRSDQQYNILGCSIM